MIDLLRYENRDSGEMTTISRFGVMEIISAVKTDDRMKALIKLISFYGDEKKAKENWRKIDELVKEMFLPFSPFVLRTFISSFQLFCRCWFQRIEIDEENLFKIRELQRRNCPIIYLPTHRSYLDFLLLTLVLYRLRLPMPLIAAANDFLSLGFLSTLMQQCGAFFIKRGFDKQFPEMKEEHFSNFLDYRQQSQNLHLIQNETMSIYCGSLYLTLLECVTRQIMKKNLAPFCFFIEGTRSRTGKSLSPKIGLLSTCIDLFLQNECYDIALVPISISFDRIFEQNLYANEMLGNKKPKETISALLSIFSLLFNDYGNIHFNFNSPIHLKDIITCSKIPFNFRPKHVQCRLDKCPLLAPILNDVSQTIIWQQQIGTRISGTTIFSLSFLLLFHHKILQHLHNSNEINEHLILSHQCLLPNEVDDDDDVENDLIHIHKKNKLLIETHQNFHYHIKINNQLNSINYSQFLQQTLQFREIFINFIQLLSPLNNSNNSVKFPKLSTILSDCEVKNIDDIDKSFHQLIKMNNDLFLLMNENITTIRAANRNLNKIPKIVNLLKECRITKEDAFPYCESFIKILHYKNQILHLLVDAAFLEASLLMGGDLFRNYGELLNLFENDFISGSVELQKKKFEKLSKVYEKKNLPNFLQFFFSYLMSYKFVYKIVEMTLKNGRESLLRKEKRKKFMEMLNNGKKDAKLFALELQDLLIQDGILLNENEIVFFYQIAPITTQRSRLEMTKETHLFLSPECLSIDTLSNAYKSLFHKNVLNDGGLKSLLFQYRLTLLEEAVAHSIDQIMKLSNAQNFSGLKN
ncbi:hypothetical protein SNEBB_000619 [Seison nebaliae]|nr:hypothetical protein SNEBB_000619 [Seison nebaliae]